MPDRDWYRRLEICMIDALSPCLGCWASADQVEVVDQQVPEPTVVFPSGLKDLSLLTSYADHGAWEVWGGMVDY